MILVASLAAGDTGLWAQGSDGFVTLFDGTDLSSFRGYKGEDVPSGWKVVDGNLMFDASARGDIVTKEQFEDFELQFEWKVSSGANSGVMYRVTLGDGAPYFSGPEYQILDNDRHRDGKNPKTSAASIYAMVAPQGKSPKPVGEWNSAKIVLNHDRLEHWLNGSMVASSVIGSDSWKELKNGSKFKTWEKFGASSTGHIAFQDHGDKVWFRNIRIRPIREIQWEVLGKDKFKIHGEVKTLEQVAEVLGSYKTAGKENYSIDLKVAADVPYQSLVDILGACQKSGFTEIRIQLKSE